MLSLSLVKRPQREREDKREKTKLVIHVKLMSFLTLSTPRYAI